MKCENSMNAMRDGDYLSGLRKEHFVPRAGVDMSKKKQDSSSEFPCVKVAENSLQRFRRPWFLNH